MIDDELGNISIQEWGTSPGVSALHKRINELELAVKRLENCIESHNDVLSAVAEVLSWDGYAHLSKHVGAQIDESTKLLSEIKND